MQQSIHDFVLDQLQDRKGHWSQIATETGISKRTIEKIARLEVKDPGVSRIEILARYFREHPIGDNPNTGLHNQSSRGAA